MKLREIIRSVRFFNLADYCGACPCAGGLELKGVRFESHCWRSNSDLGVDVYFNSGDDDCQPRSDIEEAGQEVAVQLAEIWDMAFPLRLHDEKGRQSPLLDLVAAPGVEPGKTGL